MNEKSVQASLLKPVVTKRVFEQVADQIRELIVSGVFKPDDKLPPETEMARHFNVGRAALREALRVLEGEGLIYVKQGTNGGSFIAEPNFLNSQKSIIEKLRRGEVDAQCLYEIRLNLEPRMLRYVIDRITDEELDAMEKAIAESEESIAAGSSPITHFSIFHLLVARASKNPLYEMLLGSLINYSVNLLVMGPNRQDFINSHLKQHREIFEYLREKNLKKAQSALEDHLQRVIRNIQTVWEDEKVKPFS